LRNRNLYYDLHLHSCHSDGECSLEEIIKIAKKKRIPGFSITDHNFQRFTHKELFNCGRRSGIVIVPGIEISTIYKKQSFHILGYGKLEPKIVNQFAFSYANGYNGRARKIIKNLRKVGINFSYQEIKDRYPGALYVSKNMIAQFVVEQTRYQNVQQILKTRNPYQIFFHVKENDNFMLSPKEAISLIIEANGVPFLAHPGLFIPNFPEDTKFKENLEKLTNSLVLFKKWGLKGLETEYWFHSPFKRVLFKNISELLGLFATGGTDWHGPNWTPEIKIGSKGLSGGEFRKFLKFCKLSEWF